MSSSIPIVSDADRISTATLSGSVGPVTVGFPVFGGATDLSVFVDGELIPSSDWALTSASALNPVTDVLPAGDGRVTFDEAQTGDVEIVGEIKPARASQFPPGVGISAETHNLALSKIWAALREIFAWGKASIKLGAGERSDPLPSAFNRANKLLSFDSDGKPVATYAISVNGVVVPDIPVTNKTLLGFSSAAEVAAADLTSIRWIVMNGRAFYKDEESEAAVDNLSVLQDLNETRFVAAQFFEDRPEAVVTPTLADHGKILRLSNASATLALPNDLPKGFVVAFYYKASFEGFDLETGATFAEHPADHTEPYGVNAICAVTVDENDDGESAVYVLSGFTA
jgi:hypothetical protein